MVAITPNAKNHAGLGPTASRFVDVDELPWERTRFAGIETKTLFIDKTSGSVTALIRMAPGARLPDHEHPLSEQSFVIEGTLADDDGRCTAGNFVWRPAGSRHEAWSPEGCIVLGIFQVPNKFFEAGGRIADVLGQDWAAAWGQASNLKNTG
jgi:anti-sigma factor ChrR (cupin superfamily)